MLEQERGRRDMWRVMYSKLQLLACFYYWCNWSLETEFGKRNPIRNEIKLDSCFRPQLPEASRWWG